MLETQLLRKDRDEFTAFPIVDREEIAALIRPYLTSLEARSLGIRPANDEEDHKSAFFPSIIAGLGASASTAVLFAVTSFFATLGLPDAAGTVAPFAASFV